MLSQKPIHQPQDKAEHNAENDAGRDREEDDCILSTVADVTGQTSERHMRPSSQQDEEADQDQQSSSANQQLTERVHDFILASPAEA